MKYYYYSILGLLFFMLFFATPQVSAQTPACPTLPTGTGKVTQTITINAAATADYKVWSRIKPSSTDPAANSYWLVIDGGCGQKIGDSQANIPQGEWTWVDFKNGNISDKVIASLSPGNHTIEMIGNEPGANLARVIFTDNLSCVPTGNGDDCINEPTPTNAGPTSTPAQAAATTVSLNPASGSHTVNQTFTATVTVNTGTNQITNGDLSLTFDAEKLEIVDISLGDFLTNASEIQKTINNINGTALYSFFTDNANAKSGQGTLATITLRAKSEGTGTIGFNQSETIIYGLGSGNVLTGVNNASYTINPAPTVTPTTTPTHTPTPTPTDIPTPTNTPTPTVTSTPVPPTATPTATNTPVPPTVTPTHTPTPTIVVPTNTPTNTPVPPTPTPVPCSLTSARWIASSNPVSQGTQVQLEVLTDSNCSDQQVFFTVREDDGLTSNPALNNPAAVSITAGKATSTWSAEWQEDGGGLFGAPEYYFNAALIDGSSTIRSQAPNLTVNRTPSLLTLLLKLQGLLGSFRPLSANITLLSAGNETISATGQITTNSQGEQITSITTPVAPGSYDILISVPGRLQKRIPATLDSNTSQLDLSQSPLAAGDVNADNIINTLDIGQVIEDYSPQTTKSSPADITADGYINALDIGYVIENYFKQGD